jgi:hypothetical protein
MSPKMRKAAAGLFAALTIGAAAGMAATPSAAQGWRGGGYRWHTGYWHPGYGWAGGYGWGEPLAVGAVAGYTLGALTGAAYAYAPAYAYGPAYYGGGCYLQNRPVYDSWGNFAAYAPVQVCY